MSYTTHLERDPAGDPGLPDGIHRGNLPDPWITAENIADELNLALDLYGDHLYYETTEYGDGDRFAVGYCRRCDNEVEITEQAASRTVERYRYRGEQVGGICEDCETAIREGGQA